MPEVAGEGLSAKSQTLCFRKGAVAETDAGVNCFFRLLGSMGSMQVKSVLVVLSADKILRERNPVLRPGRYLIFTERPWGSTVDSCLVKRINERSRIPFGIPAATSQPLDRA